MTAQDLSDSLTPYVQNVLVQNKADFVSAMETYFASTGLFGSILSVITQSFVSSYFWTFVLNTVLPFIVKVVVFVLISIFAPYLTVIEPFLDQLIDIIDTSLLSATQKANAKALLDAVSSVPADALPVNTNISPTDIASCKAATKYLEHYVKNPKSELFVRPS